MMTVNEMYDLLTTTFAKSTSKNMTLAQSIYPIIQTDEEDKLMQLKSIRNLFIERPGTTTLNSPQNRKYLCAAVAQLPNIHIGVTQVFKHEITLTTFMRTMYIMLLHAMIDESSHETVKDGVRYILAECEDSKLMPIVGIELVKLFDVLSKVVNEPELKEELCIKYFTVCIKNRIKRSEEGLIECFNSAVFAKLHRTFIKDIIDKEKSLEVLQEFAKEYSILKEEPYCRIVFPAK